MARIWLFGGEFERLGDGRPGLCRPFGDHEDPGMGGEGREQFESRTRAPVAFHCGAHPGHRRRHVVIYTDHGRVGHEQAARDRIGTVVNCDQRFEILADRKQARGEEERPSRRRHQPTMQRRLLPWPRRWPAQPPPPRPVSAP